MNFCCGHCWVFLWCLLYFKSCLVIGQMWLLQGTHRKSSSEHRFLAWQICSSSTLSSFSQLQPRIVHSTVSRSWGTSFSGRVPSKVSAVQLHSEDHFTLRRPTYPCYTQEWTGRLLQGCGFFVQLSVSFYFLLK